ncbi:flagellar basal body L-ring protein FlgH [Plastorhodobacter daqingensis]|uniref:Flagellar L-ring protein n=1 Tax=Plastorhodobacter daqingensis TaxID=1387281 RepID=A0ABW2UHY9_9RHOB
MTSLLRLPLLAALLATAACSTYVEERASDAYAPVYAPEPEPDRLSLPSGAIYNSRQQGLFVADRRASRVGDILTVTFSERFQASKSQSASGSKSGSFELDLPDVLTGGRNEAQFNSASARGFSGSGAAAQANSFTGRMSVSVVRVLPNGHLEIAGQKRITLNNGDEYVRLRGIVRPEDISANNIVSSDRIAHADIRYIGAGDVADTAQQGWLARAVNTVSPY